MRKDLRFSILQNKDDFDNRICYICGSRKDGQVHEVYFGTANRQKSIKYGCCVCLCRYHHNGSNEGVHFDIDLDIQLKMQMQHKFKEVYPDLDFRKIFGRNYL